MSFVLLTKNKNESTEDIYGFLGGPPKSVIIALPTQTERLY
jgi:hypothetical protein